MDVIWSDAPAKSRCRYRAPAGAPEPPEEPEPRSCSECKGWWTQGGSVGICSVELDRFFYRSNIDRAAKWPAVNATIDWVLDNLIDDEHEICEEFEKA